MNVKEKTERFAALHVKGQPLMLYNAWDAGSARAIADAGAPAIATSSWAVAAAHGYEDGEILPIGLSETVIGRIAASVNLPVTADIESGYAQDDDKLTENASRFLDLGVVGFNFEDRVIAGTGLHEINRQADRIAAIRRMADARNLPLFLNARTDLFLNVGDEPGTLMEEALRRANAYAAAGASGFFVPGLKDAAHIRSICGESPLPVNVMTMPGVPPARELAALGVARVSFGPAPYIEAMEGLTVSARNSMPAAAAGQ